MKILRLRFKNLNSLSENHEIDFEKAPLAGAGIFAITGPTGSGKSTILDAITLALFGFAARYGESIPENIMSRHTGECESEVEFETMKGRFRAYWSMKRAKKSSEGALQPTRRFLYNSNGEILAEKKNEVNAQIEELTGLNYDKFLRSVLLSQGDFAKFLQAKPDERGDLLESLTNTFIYSRLGKQAHTEVALRETDLVNLQLSLGQISLLSEEERSKLEHDILETNTELGKSQEKFKELQALCNQGKRLRENLDAKNKLLEKDQSQRKQRKDAGERFRRLETHRRAQIYAPQARILANVILSQKSLEKKVHDAQKFQEEAELELTACYHFFKSFVENRGITLKQAMTGFQENKTITDECLHQTTQWLKDNQSDHNLEEDSPTIVNLLTSLKHHSQGKAKHLEKLENLEAQEKTDNQSFIKTSRDYDKLQEELKTKKSLLEIAKTEVEKHEAPGSLEKRYHKFITLIELLEKIKKIENEEARLQKAIQEKKTEQEKNKDLKTQALHALDPVKEEHKSLVEQFQRSQLIAGLEQHRSNLKTNEPCPLCGSQDHPFKASFLTQMPTDYLAEKIRKKLSQIEKAQKHVETIQADLAKSEGALNILQNNLADKKEELQQAKKDLNSYDLEEGIELEKLRFETMDSLKEKTAAVKISLDRANELNKNLTTAQNTYNETQTTVLKYTNFTTQETALKVLRKEIQNEKTSISDAQKQIDDIRNNLKEALKPYSIPLPLLGEELTLDEIIKRRLKTYRNTLEKKRKTEKEQIELQNQIKNAETERKNIEERSEILLKEIGVIESNEDKAQKIFSWSDYTQADVTLRKIFYEFTTKKAIASRDKDELDKTKENEKEEEANLNRILENTEFGNYQKLKTSQLSEGEFQTFEREEKILNSQEEELKGQLKQVDEELLKLKDAPQGDSLIGLERRLEEYSNKIPEICQKIGSLKEKKYHDDSAKKSHAKRILELKAKQDDIYIWKRLRDLIGSHDGKKFKIFAQGLSLNLLIQYANKHLSKINDRYILLRKDEEQLDIEICDRYQANATRPTASLSGGESFLASLSLALGLSELAGRNAAIDSLFIDEGFGSLDPETLETAISALESLRASNKTIGVISHVELLKERISVQIQVVKGTGGKSSLVIA